MSTPQLPCPALPPPPPHSSSSMPMMGRRTVMTLVMMTLYLCGLMTTKIRRGFSGEVCMLIFWTAVRLMFIRRINERNFPFKGFSPWKTSSWCNWKFSKCFFAFLDGFFWLFRSLNKMNIGKMTPSQLWVKKSIDAILFSLYASLYWFLGHNPLLCKPSW